MSGAAAKERSRGSCAPRLISRRCWPPRDNSEKPGPYCSPSLVNSLRDLIDLSQLIFCLRPSVSDQK
jgi:hypothetical protein